MMQLLDDNNLLKFDCSKISAFDSEKERLFFSKKNVLKVSLIWQSMKNDEWVNYKKYMFAVDSILRMMNGLNIDNKQRSILSNIECQERMFQIIHHLFCKFNFAF